MWSGRSGRSGKPGGETSYLPDPPDPPDSVSSLNDPPSDAEQPGVGQASTVQRLGRASNTRVRHGSGLVNPVQRRVGGFARRRVLARALAELRRIALHVEDVVHDLEREAE